MFNAERVNAGCFFGFAVKNELSLVGLCCEFLAVLLNEDVLAAFFSISVSNFAVVFSVKVLDVEIRNSDSLDSRRIYAAIQQYFGTVRRFLFAGRKEFFKLNPCLGYGNLLVGFC